jgi:hypothetical protein
MMRFIPAMPMILTFQATKSLVLRYRSACLFLLTKPSNGIWYFGKKKPDTSYQGLFLFGWKTGLLSVIRRKGNDKQYEALCFAPGLLFSEKPSKSLSFFQKTKALLLRSKASYCLGGRPDLNRRPLEPQSSALTN